MFTTTFTLDRHIEELRAELRGTADLEEASDIRAELNALLSVRQDMLRETETGS